MWKPLRGSSRTTRKGPTARRSQRSSGIGLLATSSQFFLVFQPLFSPPREKLMHDVSREHIINLEDLRLWEIWYTGSTPFPSEVSSFPLTSPLFSLLLPPHSCPVGDFGHSCSTPLLARPSSRRYSSPTRSFLRREMTRRRPSACPSGSCPTRASSSDDTSRRGA